MSNKKGFTYVELMVATVIIGVIAVFLSATIPLALSNGQQVQDITKATDLAQRYMETVKSNLSYQTNYDNALAGTTPPVAITSVYTNMGYFTVQTNITNIQSATINGVSKPVLKKIDVRYSKAGSNLNIINISTLAARPE